MSNTTKEIPMYQFSPTVPKETIKNNIDEKLISKDRHWFHYAIAFSVTLIHMSSVTAVGWSSASLPTLLSSDSPIGKITSGESGWIIVAMSIGTLLSSIPVAYLMNKIGHKLTLILSAFPMIIAWLLIAFAKSIPWIYCARVLQGITFNIAFALGPMYLGEIASNQCRGSVSIIISIMSKFGFIFVYSIGAYVTIFTMALIALILPIAFIITFSFMPESPYFLIYKNKFDEAIVSLKRLRHHNDVYQEFEQIKVTIQQSKENSAHYMELFAKDNRKSVIILIGLVSIHQLCGGHIILAYASLIFARIDSQLGPKEATIILAFVQVFAAIILACIVDRVGRRVILIWSSIGGGLANTIVFLYFLLDHLSVDVNEFGLITLIALFVVTISYGMGFTGVFLTIVGEIIRIQLRPYAGALYIIIGSILTFSTSKLFQVITDNLGSHVMFGFFAICCILFIPFVYYIIPETRGRSFNEIQIMLKSGKIN